MTRNPGDHANDDDKAAEGIVTGTAPAETVPLDDEVEALKRSASADEDDDPSDLLPSDTEG